MLTAKATAQDVLAVDFTIAFDDDNGDGLLGFSDLTTFRDVFTSGILASTVLELGNVVGIVDPTNRGGS